MEARLDVSTLSPIRRKILEVAKQQVGIFENPPGSNNVKFNTWFYGREVFDGDKQGSTYPWCATAVSWIMAQAGAPLGNIGYTRGYANCPYAVSHLPTWGRQVTDPLPGDIAIFDWEGDGKFDHTGIFAGAINTELFCCYEGNTSFKNNSNGGEFMLRADRRYRRAIFIRPHIIEKLEGVLTL